MTNTICRFLATPSPVFELQTEKVNETISVQQYAIVRLAQCVQVPKNIMQIYFETQRFFFRLNLKRKFPKLLSLLFMHF